MIGPRSAAHGTAPAGFGSRYHPSRSVRVRLQQIPRPAVRLALHQRIRLLDGRLHRQRRGAIPILPVAHVHHHLDTRGRRPRKVSGQKSTTVTSMGLHRLCCSRVHRVDHARVPLVGKGPSQAMHINTELHGIVACSRQGATHPDRCRFRTGTEGIGRPFAVRRDLSGD
jgi:hypothetical protein